MRKKRTTENIVEILRARHGDKFDYSRVAWVDNNTKITLVCHHGEFTVYPGNALRVGWVGCRWCGGESRQAIYGEKVIDRFIDVHGDKYSYDNFVYRGMLTKATITCPKHGDFEMTPGNHLTNHGCASCKNNAPSAQEDKWIDAISEAIGLVPIRSVKVPGFYGTLDAAFDSVAVEYDGAYWHSRPDSLEKDIRKTNAAVEAGYEVVRLRACSKRWDLTSVPGASNVFVDEQVTEEKLRIAVETIERLLRE